MTESTKKTDKEQVFDKINTLLVKSGVFLNLVKTCREQMSYMYSGMFHDLKTKVILMLFGLMGAMLFVYGVIQIITDLLDISLYTNLIAGGILLFIAAIISVFK